VSSTPYLFVYGTLLSSERKNRFSRYLAQNADLIGKASIGGRLYALKRYPGLRPQRDLSDVVYGEVYRLRLPAPTLRTLDAYESSDYRRLPRLVQLENGQSIRSWVYIYWHTLPRHRRVDSGVWENRKS
jgi:gamma-glutamylcyclotransferase (GGCT)/AIG2-like uncharacterized protein YtfP